MISLKKIILSALLSVLISPVFADGCCDKMGGANYCDSSAGRVVCKNGFYSACYCTRHAVMDLQLLKGCCLWKGGVMPTFDSSGLIVCNDGSVSEECSLGNPQQRIAIY
ncbi:MAG: neurogenic locus notch [Legionella sp.]